ncbi:MAG: glycosyltransferase family 39 protein [Planctomycetes bacterium]|nr:glycosyltransferase family 39 protein [Planctomycetota bacterium]
MSSVDLTRAKAVLLLAFMVVGGFLLCVWNFDYGFPRVLHSDAAQVSEAVEFLNTGAFVKRSPYPPALVFGYAGALVAGHWIRSAAGIAPGESWPVFLIQLTQDGALAHGIIRIFTALAGALLPIAVYRLARLQLSRNAALLAAAMAALAPAHVIYAHQARIHVPAITILVFLARPVLRLDRGDISKFSAAVAGVACGTAIAIIQLGYLLAAAGIIILFVRARRERRSPAVFARQIAWAAFSGTVGWFAFYGCWKLLHANDVSLSESAPAIVAGIPATVFRLRFWETLPSMFARFALSEPATAGVILYYMFLSINRRAPRGIPPAFAVYPALVLAILGLNYSEVRYSLSAQPFVACIAAAAVCNITNRIARFALAALLLLSPAAASIVYVRAIAREDTRDVQVSLLPKIANPDFTASVYASAVLPGANPGPCTQLFPNRGDYWPWVQKKETPMQSFRRMVDPIFMIPRDGSGLADFSETELKARSFIKFGVITNGYGSGGALPDAPDYLYPSLFTATRTGPNIEIWCRPRATFDHLKSTVDPRAVTPMPEK